jgi:hypothetical protein
MNRKQNKEDQISEITNFVHVEATIECNNYNTCKSIEGDYDEETLAQDVYVKGWRVIDGDILCRSCVRKLKAKQK